MSIDRERLPIRAFPQPQTMKGEQIISPTEYGEGGMALRDYFAAAVVAGLIPVARQGASKGDDVAKMTAEFAYEVAEAMMEARKR